MTSVSAGAQGDDRLVTLAIHTCDRAQAVKALLEGEGVAAELHNVRLDAPEISPGVRVRIHESDLPLALRIVENTDIFIPTAAPETSQAHYILVPTDFSDYAARAAAVAFHLASATRASIVLLNAALPQASTTARQLSQVYRYDVGLRPDASQQIKQASEQMSDLTADLRRQIKQGEIPPVKFTTEIVEGLPEEKILEYMAAKPPLFVVMGTRGKNKKEAELIGSVTAEVLDQCRACAFTIPEGLEAADVRHLKRVAFFCNLEQEDLLALDALHRLFPTVPLEVTLMHVPSRRTQRVFGRSGQGAKEAVRNLLTYCRARYGGFSFEAREVDVAQLARMQDAPREHFSLVCVPNKSRNVFTRFFNPSLPHKILFSADIPMMVIPV